MGAAACAWLSRRGARVLGLEQFTRGHDKGSSHGGSRVVRETYFESADYVPLVRRAMAQFRELEEIWSERLFHHCGVLYMGEPEGSVIRGVTHSAEKHGIPIDRLGAAELRQRFPMFSMQDGATAVFEPGGGFVRPERCVRAWLRLAEGHGAVIREGECVERIEERGHQVDVETDAEIYAADSVIVTGGAWTARLVPELASLLRPTRQPLAWIKPSGDPADGDARRCPVWFTEDGARGPFYGIPTADDQDPPLGLKIARHVPGETVDPDAPCANVTEGERSDLEDAMRRLVPGAAGRATTATTCFYTMTPDEHFIIDRAPFWRRTLVACGFSGHGFKFAPVVGEILADLALDGSTRQPCDFLRYSRFDA